MAVMLAQRSLRSTPGGEPTGVHVLGGMKVTILETKLPWTKIRIEDDNHAEGWVSDFAIMKDADFLPALGRDIVAQECVDQANTFGVNAFYLMMACQQRTNVTNSFSGNAKGLFGFSEVEWTANSSHPDIGIEYDLARLEDWRAQCTLFAIMAVEKQIDLAKALGDEPTLVQLYLAQTIGAKAASVLIKDPNTSIESAVETAKANAQSEKLDIACFTQRDAGLLTGPTGKDVLEGLEAKLDVALDFIRMDIRSKVEKYQQAMLALGSAAPQGIATIRYESKHIVPARKKYAKLIASKFAAQGYGAIQQIAAVANAIAESSLDPGESNMKGESSIGLFQLNQKGGVGTGFTTEVLSDPDRNIEIMLAEISKPYNKKNRADFIGAKSLFDAVKIFVYAFERPKDKAGETKKRYEIAQSLVG